MLEKMKKNFITKMEKKTTCNCTEEIITSSNCCEPTDLNCCEPVESACCESSDSNCCQDKNCC
jgi:hypothetical protein